MKFTAATICAVALSISPTSAFSPSHVKTAVRPSSSSSSLYSTTEETSTSSTTSSPLIQQRDFFSREAWLGGFTSATKEVCYELPDADFPTDLVGTFYQNGHAKFQVGDDIVLHPFDADGMISAVTFNGKGKAWFRNRYVETKGFVDELATNKVEYRGVFGTARNKGKWWSNIFRTSFKNVANTHVLFRRGDKRLFALWEAGLPHEIDPITLETMGESDLDGTLGDLTQYAAHYKVDPTTGNICNFVVGPGKSDPLKEHELFVMEHDQDGNLLYRHSHIFPRVGLNHDCAITDNYFVFIQTPATIDPLPFVLGQKGVGQCFEFDQQATSSTMLLIPRNGSPPIEIDIPKTFTFHTGNAFEDEDGTLVVDTIVADKMLLASDGNEGYPERPIWETMDLEKELLPYQLRRIRVDPSTQSFVSQTPLTKAAKTVEFPIVNPAYVGKPYQYTYCGASPSDTIMSPIQGIAKVDVVKGEIVQKWLPEPDCFLGELSFVPRATGSAEDDGYLVGYMINGKETTTSLVIFDAQNIAQGPIKTCGPLKSFIPHVLHGTFVQGLTPEFNADVAALYPPKR